MSQEIKMVEMDREEYERMLNDYQSYIATFTEGFITKLFSNGIITEVDMNQLKKYFANPDEFQKEIEDLAQYYYISSAEVHQLYELVESLPTLNYKIDSFEKTRNYEKFITQCNKALYKIKHKTLTRDLLKQETTAGTLVGIWLGDSKNPYPYIFDNLDLIFPAYRKNGEWQVVIDMQWFRNMKDVERENQLNNLSPFVTKADYNNYVKDTVEYQYKELPQDRTFVLRTHTLKRNQNLGISWVTPGLYDVQHKKKLKDVERSIANKIINAVAILKIGSDKNNGEYSNLKLPSPIKKKVHGGVKAALEKNQTNGVTVVSIPDWADVQFPDVKTDGLDGKKFDHINSDIQSAYGVASALINGEGSNFAGAKINLETIYKRIAVLLENIEQEVYQKLFNLILPASQRDNFYMVYDKEPPLTLKEQVDILMKLNDKGWSIKHVVDKLPGISFDSYLAQTLHETDELKLQEKIKPYMSTHTTSANVNGGRPSIDNPINENTNKSKTGDSNNTPTV